MNKKKSIFECKSYREFLEKMIDFNREVYGYKAKLAEAAGCQRSFISQVLSGQCEFAFEHGIGLSQFWRLSEIEKDFFLNLIGYSRAANKALQDHFTQKLDEAKRNIENLSRRIENKVVLPDTKAAIFYSNWHYLAITIVLTISEYRTPKSISQRLNLAEEVVESSLRELLQLEMVEKKGNEWAVINDTIHLARDSKFNSLNHSHWRSRAVQDSLLSENRSVHYTSVCSLSFNDAETLRQLMFQFIDESRKIVTPSKEEELFCLTCDWFRV